MFPSLASTNKCKTQRVEFVAKPTTRLVLNKPGNSTAEKPVALCD